MSIKDGVKNSTRVAKLTEFPQNRPRNRTMAPTILVADKIKEYFNDLINTIVSLHSHSLLFFVNDVRGRVLGGNRHRVPRMGCLQCRRQFYCLIAILSWRSRRILTLLINTNAFESYELANGALMKNIAQKKNLFCILQRKKANTLLSFL